MGRDHDSIPTMTAITGVVLAGGQSRRMGRDKALLEVGGRAIIARAYAAVAQVAAEVLVSGGSRYKRLLPDARFIDDAVPGAGPIAGIVAALRAASTPYCLVVGCDMPFLNVSLLRHLAHLAPTADAVVPEVDGVTHQAHAIYAKSCLDPLERQMAAHQYRVQDVFSQVRTRFVSNEEIERFDPLHRSLLNVNTPEDLAEAQRIAAECNGLSA